MARDRFDRLYVLIGDRVCVARKAKGLSQTKLAERIQINRVSIVNIERGKQRPPIDLLWRLAHELDVELTELIPRKVDFDRPATGVQLSHEDLAAIEAATTGNTIETRLIQDFVQRAKTRSSGTP
jgi:transcriptional regulator with XRE-family HTH domain